MTDSIVTTRDLKAISSARDVQGIATARLMKAVDVRLLASTLNRYFSDVQSMTESASIGFSKGAADAFSVAEAAVFAIGKGASDTLTLSESPSIVTTYIRAFSDASSLSEASAIGFDKVVNDTNNETMSMIESSVMGFDKGASDTISIAEASVQAVELAKTDSFTVTEVFSRVATFTRVFADAFAMDDAATVDAFVKDYDGNKANVFSFSDSEAIGFEKAATDSFSFVDAPGVGFDKGVIADSVSISESFSFTLRGGTTINAVALNENTLN